MKTLMICDDDLSLVKVIKFLFQADKFEIISEESGNKILAKAKEYKPSLILLDLMLPDKDGFTVLEELKSEPVTADIPVIVMSAIQGNEHIERVRKMGCADYIVKPFNPVNFRKTVLKYLK